MIDFDIHEGGCLCGTMRYRTSGSPVRVTVCHCRFCQRATGSAYLVEPVFSLATFEMTSGTPTVYRHRSEGSGKLVDVHFCPACGTKLFLTFERFEGAVGLYAGTFDDPGWIEVRLTTGNTSSSRWRGPTPSCPPASPATRRMQ